MMDMMVRRSNYSDDSGVDSYTSSANGSVSSSSNAYLPPPGIGFDSSEPLPPVGVRLIIPELDIETHLQLNQNDTVWNIKQCIICTIATNLEDGINHGIFCPPVNGKAGKYLDEERYLGEYNLQDDTVIQFIQKRRVYKTLAFDWRKIQEFNTKTRCKKLLNYLRSGHLEKLKGLLMRGLDPNFQDSDTGETPLTIAATARSCRNLIMTLIDGGAILDYRNRLGLTSLHRAAQYGNKEAVETLLELGASPNYKDIRGLTPLYFTVCNDTDAACAELLLRDYSIVGARDESGWTEIHQACKYGRVQHLQHLVFYGSDVNGRNFSGNTPLHICALNNQEECARVLLFRGADKSIRNFLNQDPRSLACLSGFPLLAETIDSFSSKDIVLHQEAPRYNTRRRRMTQSFRGIEEESNFVFLQRHLSRSTSHLPDIASTSSSSYSSIAPSSSSFSGSISKRKSLGENPYQSISRSSSLSRRGSSRSLRSRTPEPKSAFEEPKNQNQPPRNTVNLMSCDAASQRARAKSRSKARNVLARFKETQSSSESSEVDPSLPRPPPPPQMGQAEDHRPSTPSRSIACLREVVRPRSESGSGQSNRRSGELDQFYDPHQQHRRSALETGPMDDRLQKCSGKMDDGRVWTPSENHRRLEQQSGSQLVYQSQKNNMANHADNQHKTHEAGQTHLRRLRPLQIPAPPYSETFSWTSEENDRTAKVSESRDYGSPRVGHMRTSAWKTPPPPPPPTRANAPGLSTFRRMAEADAPYGGSEVAEPPRPPIYSGLRHSYTQSSADAPSHLYRANDRSHVGAPYSSTPSLYHPEYASPPRETALRSGFLDNSSRPRSSVEIQPLRRPLVKAPQMISPSPSPLPPFPEDFPSAIPPDNRPLPPPPITIDNYVPPPPMFHTASPLSPPPPPPPPLPLDLNCASAWNRMPHSSPAQDPEAAAAVSRGGRTSREREHIMASAVPTDLESALFAAVLRRRQAIEEIPVNGICL